MKTIVCGIDTSATAQEAAQRAAALAEATGSPLHLVTALPKRRAGTDVQGGGEHWSSDDLGQAEAYLADVAGRLLPAGQVTCSVIRDEPAAAMVTEATRLSAEIIVVGNKRMKGAGRILGAVATEVLRKAPCDVLVAHTT